MNKTRKRRFTIAVVGCGYIAKRVHLPLLTKSRNVEVVALCDVDDQAALETSRIFGVKNTYKRLDEIPESERPDIVDICTPPTTHAQLAKEAFEMGCHCVLEKPMAATVREADEIIKASAERGLHVFVMHNYSYVPCIRAAMHAVAEGKVGKIMLTETRYFTSLQRERFNDGAHWIHKLPGGILNSELLPHLLMLVIDFIGYPILETQIMTNRMMDLPYISADEIKMSMLSIRKAIGYIGLSFNSPTLFHTLEVIGERGSLFVDHLTQTVVYHKAPHSNIAADKEIGSPLFRGTWALKEFTQKATGVTTVALNTALGRYKMSSEGHRFLFEQCFKSLNGEAQYPVDVEKCREVVRLLENACGRVHP